MENKKQKIWGWSLVVGSLLIGGLAAFNSIQASPNGGIPKKVPYQAPVEEKLTGSLENLTLGQTDGIQFNYEGHDYKLDITTDQKYVSPLPGATVTGKITLLKDGQPTKEVPDFLNTRVLTPDGYVQMPKIRLDLPRLGQDIFTQAGGVFLGEQKVQTLRDIWRPWRQREIYLGRSAKDQTLDEAYAWNSPWSIRLSSPQATDFPGELDFTNGEASFTYQHDGLRVYPYLELVAYGGGEFYNTGGLIRAKLTSSYKLPFQDQLSPDRAGKKVDVPTPITQAKNDDFHYEVVTSPVRLKPNEKQRISIGIVSRKGTSNAINTHPRQRVHVTVGPLYGHFNMTKVENIANGYDKKTRYVGEVQLNYLGKVLESDDIKHTYKGRLDNLDAYVLEVDLVEGRAQFEFEYSGTTLPLPYLAVTVRPADFFINYTGWNNNPPAAPTFRSHSADKLIEECERTNSCWAFGDHYDEVKAPLSNREIAGITYPAPPNPEAVTHKYHTPTGYHLYQDAWYKAPDFVNLVNSTTTVKLIPLTSNANTWRISWIWFVSLQGATLLAWAVQIYLKRKQKLRI